MPTYDYKCDACGHEFEIYQSMKDDKLSKCPNCGKETLKRLIGSGAGLIFKGSGFYLTDYKNKTAETTQAKTTSPDSPKAETAPVSKETVKTESKSAAETTPKKTEKKESKTKTENKK